MPGWRELVRTVPGTLMLVVDGTTTRLLMHFDRAHGRLQRVINLVRSLLRGETVHPRPSAEQCPSVDIEEARRELYRLSVLHDEAERLFDICAMFLSLQDGPLWQSWEGHRAAALDHAAEARHWLRSAAANARAAMAADRIADSFHRQSPVWDEWVITSLKHARRIIWDEMRAHSAVLRMRHAVVLQFFDAWMILNRLERGVSKPATAARAQQTRSLSVRPGRDPSIR